MLAKKQKHIEEVNHESRGEFCLKTLCSNRKLPICRLNLFISYFWIHFKGIFTLWYCGICHIYSFYYGFIVFFHRNSCGDFGPFEKLIDSV